MCVDLHDVWPCVYVLVVRHRRVAVLHVFPRGIDSVFAVAVMSWIAVVALSLAWPSQCRWLVEWDVGGTCGLSGCVVPESLAHGVVLER